MDYLKPDERRELYGKYEVLLDAVVKMSEGVGHTAEAIEWHVGQIRTALRFLDAIPAYPPLTRHPPQVIIPIRSAEHHEFVEQNYPVLKPAAPSVLFPCPMVYCPGTAHAAIFHSGAVETIHKCFSNGYAHTAIFSVLKNRETQEYIRMPDGGLARVELSLLGLVDIR